MSKIVLYLPGNAWHSNVRADKRRAYIEGFRRDWLAVLKQAGIPVVVSFQKVDLELFGVSERELAGGNLECLSAPWNHALPSLYEKHPTLSGHARWLADHAVKTPTLGMFFAEYDVPRTRLAKPGIIPALPSPHMVQYSECGTGDYAQEAVIDRYRAVRYHDNTVVPMVGVKPIQDAFFAWQRDPDNASKKEALATEIRKVALDGTDDALILFLDLEAPLCGSHYGPSIWEWFFTVAKEAAPDAFVTWHWAAEQWMQSARSSDVPVAKLFARNLGVKWTGLQPQLDWLDRVKLCRAPQSDREHALMGLFTGSDVLSAWDRKLKGPITLAADRGPIEIGFDQAVIDVALACLKAYESGGNPVAALRSLGLGEDKQWFADRLADVLAKAGW